MQTLGESIATERDRQGVTERAQDQKSAVFPSTWCFLLLSLFEFSLDHGLEHILKCYDLLPLVFLMSTMPNGSLLKVMNFIICGRQLSCLGQQHYEY